MSWQRMNWIYMVSDKYQCRGLAMTKELLTSQWASASWCLSLVLDSSQSHVHPKLLITGQPINQLIIFITLGNP
jgi:hypothetical protein